MEVFIERPDDKFSSQVNTFCNKIDTYKGVLELDDTKVDALKDSRMFIVAIILFNPDIQTFAEGFTHYKNLARYGHGSDVLGALPMIPPYPTPVPLPTQANIQKQFSDLIQDCVRSSAFTQAMGEDLGIVKPVTPFNPEEGKPVIKAKLVESGHPLLHVTKGLFQGWVLYKATGAAAFVKVDKIFHPNFVDHDPLPAPGQSAIWRYKAEYLYQDGIVGTESDVVSVTVFGGAA
jgi:hypothetical protein